MKREYHAAILVNRIREACRKVCACLCLKCTTHASDPSRKILSLSKVQHKRQRQTVDLHRMYNWRCRLLAAHVLGILFQSADVSKHHDARERYQRVRIHNNPFHRSCRSSRSAQRNGSAILCRCLRCTQRRTILSTSSLRLTSKFEGLECDKQETISTE